MYVRTYGLGMLGVGRHRMADDGSRHQVPLAAVSGKDVERGRKDGPVGLGPILESGKR
jgi:hypothetical protein